MRPAIVATKGWLAAILWLIAWTITGCVETTEKIKWGAYTGKGNELLEQGRYAEAEQHYVAALNKAETYLAPQDVAMSHQNLGVLYSKMHSASAEPHFRRAIEIHDKVSRPDDLSLGKSLGGLGLFYYDQGRFVEAVPLLRRALPILEKNWGPEGPAVADIREKLRKAQD